MGKKWKVKRGFVKLHVVVDAQTVKIVALSVTDELVADVPEFRSLLGQSVDAAGARGGAADAPDHSEDPGPDTPAEEPGGGSPPLAPPPSARPSGDELTASDIVYGDAAYGSRYNVAACARAGMVSGILRRISVTARGKRGQATRGAYR